MIQGAKKTAYKKLSMEYRWIIENYIIYNCSTHIEQVMKKSRYSDEASWKTSRNIRRQINISGDTREHEDRNEKGEQVEGIPE